MILAAMPPPIAMRIYNPQPTADIQPQIRQPPVEVAAGPQRNDPDVLVFSGHR
jgi:hypothetical protein